MQRSFVAKEVHIDQDYNNGNFNETLVNKQNRLIGPTEYLGFSSGSEEKYVPMNSPAPKNVVQLGGNLNSGH